MRVEQAIFLSPPKDFAPTLDVAACYVEHAGKYLFLKRRPDDFEGNRWGIPAGKAEPGEHPNQGVLREVLEETGISLQGPKVSKVGQLFIRRPHIDFIYHLFHTQLPNPTKVTLSEEHLEYVWLPKEEALQLPLMIGEKEALQHFTALQSDRRPKTTLCVHLLPIKDGKLLLSFRKNTGYEDDKYGLIAGHVENGESAVQAMIREAKEEAGISLATSELQFVHFTHHQSNRVNGHLFFACREWDGKFTNREPEKCGGLEWFSFDQLPANMVEYIAEALALVRENESYSEKGW